MSATTVTHVKLAQVAGEYRPTAIDVAKAEVDFRLVAVGKKTTIAWRDGRIEQVSEERLKQLQAQHSWVTDF